MADDGPGEPDRMRWSLADVERDRRYTERFSSLEANIGDRFRASEIAVSAALSAQEKAVQAAFAAQEKSTTAAFAASEKAITKAEDAQRAYNERSNEFRAALDDSAKLQLSRTEADGRFKTLDDKMEEAKAQISSLRESRQEYVGRDTQAVHGRESNQWAIGLGLSVIGVGLAILGTVLAL